jgi:APA family basic amino acid/polyamine antiporter
MALTISAIFRLRGADLDHAHHYRAPLYPFLPAALVVGAFTLVTYSVIERPVESLYGAATVLSGIPLYMFWQRVRRLSSSRQLPAKPHETKG